MKNSKNRFSGVNLHPENTTAKAENSTIDADSLAISVANFAIAQLARAETVNDHVLGRNQRGFFKAKTDERKSFADVLITNHGKKAAIVINKDAATVKAMEKLAKDAGYSVFYNCKNFKEFKEWYKTNLQ
jgi:hypothetical protein